MAMKQNEWCDISVELYREYIYENGSVVRVDAPMELHVAPSSMGGHAHRIKTGEGKAYYIAPGWKAIRWEVREGNGLFKF